MSSDSNELIEKLSRDLKPIRPLPRAGVRAGVLTVSTLTLAFLVLVITRELRPDLAASLHRPVYLIQGFAMLAAGVLAGFATFRLSVPDTKIRLPVVAALAVSSGIWLILIGSELLQSEWTMPERSETCLVGLTLAMAVPLVIGVVMVMHSAPVWRGWAGYALLLSVGSLAALAMRFICPNDSPAHLLVWHFLPVLILSLIGVPLGKILLKEKWSMRTTADHVRSHENHR